MTWNPAKEEKLRDLWADPDKSASMIAKELNVDLTINAKPITRDMVIGKARRMGLDPRPSPIKRKPEHA